MKGRLGCKSEWSKVTQMIFMTELEFEPGYSKSYWHYTALAIYLPQPQFLTPEELRRWRNSASPHSDALGISPSIYGKDH